MCVYAHTDTYHEHNEHIKYIKRNFRKNLFLGTTANDGWGAAGGFQGPAHLMMCLSFSSSVQTAVLSPSFVVSLSLLFSPAVLNIFPLGIPCYLCFPSPGSVQSVSLSALDISRRPVLATTKTTEWSFQQFLYCVSSHTSSAENLREAQDTPPTSKGPGFF